MCRVFNCSECKHGIRYNQSVNCCEGWGLWKEYEFEPIQEDEDEEVTDVSGLVEEF